MFGNRESTKQTWTVQIYVMQLLSCITAAVTAVLLRYFHCREVLYRFFRSVAFLVAARLRYFVEKSI